MYISVTQMRRDLLIFAVITINVPEKWSTLPTEFIAFDVQSLKEWVALYWCCTRYWSTAYTKWPEEFNTFFHNVDYIRYNKRLQSLVLDLKACIGIGMVHRIKIKILNTATRCYPWSWHGFDSIKEHVSIKMTQFYWLYSLDAHLIHAIYILVLKIMGGGVHNIFYS